MRPNENMQQITSLFIRLYVWIANTNWNSIDIKMKLSRNNFIFVNDSQGYILMQNV